MTHEYVQLHASYEDFYQICAMGNDTGKRALDKLIKEVKQADNRFKCTSCPICFEDFAVDDNISNGTQYVRLLMTSLNL